MNTKIKSYLNTYSDTVTLAFYRLAFGFMMFLSMVRFAANGWIDKFYIEPNFHFSYYGFEWVKPFGNWTYLLFILCAVSAILVAIGYQYRLAIIVFFLSFTYIELMDKTTYLNHYYFISIVAFTFIFLPANAYFSVDAFKNPKLLFSKIPRWNIDILKLLLFIVYFYAGLAKLNSDWLIEAMPLKIWLPNKEHLPVFGQWLNNTFVIYAFSYLGALYDLGIVFLLLWKPTRIYAFATVVFFHLMTRILFPIGVFPYVMIISTLLFFDADFHRKILGFIAKWCKFSGALFDNGKTKIQHYSVNAQIKLTFLALFVSFQLLFPFRYLAYPGELFWTEEGFRFSWRVMLMEKAGYTQFNVVDSVNGKKIHVNNTHFLTTFQEKQMAFQPDFILEYAHFLHDHYQQLGFNSPKVYAESYVALNGRLSKKFVNPNVDLAQEQESFTPKNWLMPFEDEISGL